MKMRVFQDLVRLCAFLGCFMAGLSVLPAYSGEMCDSAIDQRIQQALQYNAAAKQDALHQALPGPASRDAIANTPCITHQMDDITKQFSDAPAAAGISLARLPACWVVAVVHPATS